MLLSWLQLESANAELLRQNATYEKVLAVRDAMLATFTSLHITPQQQQQQQQQGNSGQQQQEEQGVRRQAMLEGAPQQQQQQQPGGAATVQHSQEGQQLLLASTVAQGLAQALDVLLDDDGQDGDGSGSDGKDSDHDVHIDAMLAGEALQPVEPEGLPPAHLDSSSNDGAGASLQGEAAPNLLALAAVTETGNGATVAPQSLLANAHRSGAAGTLDGSALLAVESIPPPSNQAVRAKIAAMTEPEELVSGMHS